MEDLVQRNYKHMLLELSDFVEDHTLEAMKFRCSHFIKLKEREKIKYPHQLWVALEQRDFIGPSNTEFLKELINTCLGGLRDPYQVVEGYERQCEIRSGSGNQPSYQLQWNQWNRPLTPTPCPQIWPLTAPRYHQERLDIQSKQNGKQTEPTYCGPDLSKEIAYLTRSLGRDWRFYIRALGMQENVIESMSCDYSTVRERIHQCLLSWLEQQQQNASRERLIEALVQIERNDLANRLEEHNFQ